MKPVFENYADWHAAMTEVGGVVLDPAYCKERIAVLSDDSDGSTMAFLSVYGAAHRDQVVRWFEQAIAES